MVLGSAAEKTIKDNNNSSNIAVLVKILWGPVESSISAETHEAVVRWVLKSRGFGYASQNEKSKHKTQSFMYKIAAKPR